MSVLIISERRSFLFRFAIFIGLVTAVTTIIYFTPIPAQYPQSCSRPCHELDWPMICRIKLTLERFHTLGNACSNCPSNHSSCYLSGCITVDGQPRGLLTVNRQFPGPAIEVCQNDILLVDVINRIPGQSFGVHWRGQSQRETPYMDGVPMITQCPILSLTTYQYKFRASEAGTHMWQVNTGDELLDSLFGPLIVKKPNSREIHRNLYDTDDSSNVVVIHNWNPDRVNFLFEDETSKTKLLINGKTEENGVPPSVFKISAGKRHRFRVMYVGGTTNCQIRFSIDHHKFLVIALDGRPIQPETVSSAKLFPGERLDLVLKADQKIASYHMRATPIACPNLISTSAFVQYYGKDKTGLTVFHGDSTHKSGELAEIGTTANENRKSASSKTVSFRLENIHSIKPIPSDLSKSEPDAKFYFFYNFRNVVKSPPKGVGEIIKVARTNNVTMMLPSSPLISQAFQIPRDAFCNGDLIPSRCEDGAENVCECSHVVKVPLDSVVELILVNQDDKNHVFHLHGYYFHVVASAKLPPEIIQPETVKKLDGVNKLFKRNFDYPVEKDTVAVVANSVVAVRFKANNPGYWLLDEEQSSHWYHGMSLVLKVGEESDFPPIPENFPTCGDWIGPEYFLT